MKKTLIAAAIVALAELLNHAPTLAQFRWCPRCIVQMDPYRKGC